MKRLGRYSAIILAFSFLFSCAGITERPVIKKNSLPLTDVSEGLPQDGQWRQNIALADMDGDGYLDIVAPPPRSAEEGQNMPHIFLWDGGKWKDGAFTFPSIKGKGYGYGGIAVGDLNRDGFPDIVLAVHQKKIIVLENNKNRGFIEKPFVVSGRFDTRTVDVADLNGDGLPDIAALSEASFGPRKGYQPRGILTGLNMGDKGWDVKIIASSDGLFGDSMADGDLRGDGNRDIILAPLMSLVRGNVKLVWLGDGKGDLRGYDGKIIEGNVIPFFVRAGDIDGDGVAEIVFRISEFGLHSRVFLSAYKWEGVGFVDISGGLEKVQDPIAFDLADADGDGKKELIVLSSDGIRVYKYVGGKWTGQGYYQLPADEARGVYDLEAGRNKDGSLVIVYNLGQEGETYHRGIRAFVMK